VIVKTFRCGVPFAAAALYVLFLNGCAANPPRAAGGAGRISDHVIVPGERIGPVRLSANIDKLAKLLGPGRPRGRGLWPGSELRTWDRIGLWAVFDRVTGNLLWISIDTSGRNPLIDYATADGIRLGTSEKELVATMGPAERTAANSGVRGLYYDSRGIRFTLFADGPQRGRVGALRIVWASVPHGDEIIVPGERISAVHVGAAIESVTTALSGGYLKKKVASASFVYYWPHLGLSVVEQSGHVISVRAGALIPTEEPTLLYATEEGLARGSPASQVVRIFEEPPGIRRSRFGGEWWTYHRRGIAFELDKKQLVRLIDVFSPASD
jgi:hypothetical protein